MAAEANNKYAAVWTVENAKPYFEDALKYAEENNDCLCLQDAIYESGIPYSTFYYLADKHKDLEKIKKDIQAAVVRRINRGSLTGDMQVTAGIWRMKQLGEVDKQEIKQHHTGNITQKRVIIKDYSDDAD